MASRKKEVRIVSTTRSIGRTLGSLPESQPDMVIGYREARTPELVELRREINEAVVADGAAALIEEAQAKLKALRS